MNNKDTKAKEPIEERSVEEPTIVILKSRSGSPMYMVREDCVEDFKEFIDWYEKNRYSFNREKEVPGT